MSCCSVRTLMLTLVLTLVLVLLVLVLVLVLLLPMLRHLRLAPLAAARSSCYLRGVVRAEQGFTYTCRYAARRSAAGLLKSQAAHPKVLEAATDLLLAIMFRDEATSTTTPASLPRSPRPALARSPAVPCLTRLPPEARPAAAAAAVAAGGGDGSAPGAIARRAGLPLLRALCGAAADAMWLGSLLLLLLLLQARSWWLAG
jgi:hypothetical protein